MPSNSRFRSLARLVIGGALNGLDALTRNMDDWEKRSELRSMNESMGSPSELPAPAARQAGPTPPLEASAEQGPSNLADAWISSDATIQIAASETTTERLAYLLAGLLVASEQRIDSTLDMAGRATRLVGNWAELLGGPIYNSRSAQPLRRMLSGWTDRGQLVVDRWMEQGRSEVDTGRRVANSALTEQVDKAIDYLTANDEVQELVQSQSAGLVDEVIEETRERTVSADNFLEAVVRSVLRLPPRWELPAPPEELKKKAEEGARQYHGRILRK